MGVIAESQVDKKPYKNQTAGWLGVVKLDHLGQQIGESVEPYGTVFLTDDEALLTARAPKSPKDNPFTEKEYEFVDERGEHVKAPMRPLVLITDERELPDPNERYVPGLSQHPPQHTVHLPTAHAGQSDTDAKLEADDDREVATTEGEDPTPGKPALHPSVHPHVLKESWADPSSNWSPDPQPGRLGGEDPAATPVEEADQDSSSTGETAEETAATTSTGEETGAAATPEGQAPEGEFAQHEEVGTPDAPEQVES